jgi:hypothetical protein
VPRSWPRTPECAFELIARVGLGRMGAWRALHSHALGSQPGADEHRNLNSFCWAKRAVMLPVRVSERGIGHGPASAYPLYELGGSTGMAAVRPLLGGRMRPPTPVTSTASATTARATTQTPNAVRRAQRSMWAGPRAPMLGSIIAAGGILRRRVNDAPDLCACVRVCPCARAARVRPCAAQ